jgi:chaperonin GroEL
MDEGIVPGGGVALLRATRQAAAKVQAEGDELTGVNMLAAAAAAPIRLIADNAGLSGEVAFHRVSQGEDDFGFDAENDQYGGMFEMGIVDPAKVTRSALENAASVAGMVLTTQSLITDVVPEDDDD